MIIQGRCRECGRITGEDLTCYRCQTREHTLWDLTTNQLLLAVERQADDCVWHHPPVACLEMGCGGFGQATMATVLTDRGPRCYSHSTREDRVAFWEKVKATDRAEART